MNENIPEISIVILCYKSGKNAKDFVDSLMNILSRRLIDDYELILVANYHPGTYDETPDITREIAANNPKITVIAKPKEGMMGWDMRSGLEIARGKYITVIDGDKQMPVEDLIRVYDVIKNEDVDLVKTYRITRGDGLWRIFISVIYNIFFKLFFPGLRSKDINSKPKILRQEAYKKLCLTSNDWFIDAEIMIQARRYKFRINEIPTHFHGLGGARRSFVRLPAIVEFIKNLIVYRIKEYKYFLKK